MYKKTPPQLKLTTKEELEHMLYEQAPKMVKVGTIYGCDIWVDLTDKNEQSYHAVQRFLYAVVHPVVKPSEAELRRRVAKLETFIKDVGYNLDLVDKDPLTEGEGS